VIWKRADREQQEVYQAKILLVATIMVSDPREKVFFRFWVMKLLNCLFWVGDLSWIHPNFFPQSVIKPEMKIELRMEGDVNGHKFVITGEGMGQPFE